jgi:argininosuccinate lyase
VEPGAGAAHSLRGRFGGPTDPEFQRYSSSLAIDLRMVEEEIAASTAHARMLGEVGLLSAEEAERLAAGLAEVGRELAAGEWRPGDELEDVHMAVEARLVETLGDLGRKLHTARSRNDQVATDVRLWLKRRLAELDGWLAELVGALLDRVERDGRTLMPGYTHLQRGQPILLGHHLLAHAWPLARDRGRVADALRRLDECPLGACALAGTAHPIDRERTAELLGFARPAPNAMDAVAARDGEQEVAAACAILMTNLSRQAEELVLWSSAEWRFVRLGEAYATGSSIMPQKRNPDAAELVRGKAATVQGDLMALLALAKNLPLAYDRDLQEGREPLFHAVETASASCRILAGVWTTLEIDRNRFEHELAGDFSLATELADCLVGEGVPFREAHEAVGGLVRNLEAAGRDLGGITLEELRQAHPRFPDGALEWLDPRAAAERRTSLGGTAWSEVQKQVEALRGASGSA